MDTKRSGFDSLTPVESEILNLMMTCDGDISNKMIANTTFRSIRTIQTHLKNIMEKTRDEGVYNRTTLLLAYARHRGWLKIEDSES